MSSCKRLIQSRQLLRISLSRHRTSSLNVGSFQVDNNKSYSKTHLRSLHTTNGRFELEQNVVKSKFGDVPISSENYFEYTWGTRDKHGHRLAVVDGVTDKSLTYTEAYRQSKNFALALKNLGAKKGDVLAMFTPNCIEYPLIFAACPGIGVTVTTLNPIYTSHEIAKQIKMSRASWAVTTPALLPTFLEALKDLKEDSNKWDGRIFLVGDNIPSNVESAHNLLEKDLPGELNVDIDVGNDVCVLPFSSGTTGVPKGVMLTHKNMVANVCQGILGPPEIQLMVEASDSFQPVTISVLPLFHAFAMNVTMTPCLRSGAKMVIMPKFDPKTFAHAIKTYRPTFMHLAPPLVSFVATSPDILYEDLEQLEHIVVAAAPSGPSLIKKFKAKAPHCVYREGWGMTETGPLVNLTSLEDELNGSCGLLVPNTDAKIVDVNTGEALGPHQRGELCCRGPQMMKGYLDNPEATASTLRGDWLHSGDIAVYDEEGHFFIVDRLKELIKVKGFQVPPAELEDLLRSHAHIYDVAVIGIPDEKFGEAPRAFIVKTPGTTLTEDDVHKFMKENAAPYKQLVGGIEFRDVIPKTASGKILRKDLTREYLESINKF